ncbi:LacI family transcriptional regulator [Thermobispora bispora]|jgi:DNA-binding LacI/PurR family transcriptional regulator|uniref:Transcriptional regulator, LacI family n=1 Tax=Thermobispora bispora (strain ATCC 19993 / DSM 43833 / CBS 139.67 / JCM 10125 / KCTC 9307 / NBRC 14880 / R51) TaxID=469371 RepID=D6Y334_THEBD|nr:transcriptional regulator, LacI family [Thermobispora bispora DSM 43833]MBO2473478.1 LacI family transcriptional regulator [Actinomycetales bacterium]MBX6168764.1 LacI family DNA-binding transcriptional regulator [Thermobispora bispora]QSI48653.1 LacI family transcriptional regulator [Thermobispora bispora]
MVESFPGARSRRTTIKDVAEAAGVGVATVSRVFSGGPVSDETREKVLAAAARLDYRPSALGRNLRQRRRGGIGLLVPDITDGFYAGLADGVLACARSYGEPVTVGVTGDDPEQEAEMIGTMIEQSMDRIVAVPTGDAEMWAPALRAGLEVIFAERRVRPDVPGVLTDDASGVRTALEYLTGLGHRRIAFLAQRGQSRRVAAFTDALTALGIQADPELIVHARASRDSAYAVAAGLLQSRTDLTAIIAGSNLLGEAVVLAARELAVRIPRDLSLIMFDDVPWAELCSPPLTVIARPAQDVGYRAAELALRQGRRPKTVTLPAGLIVRASCGPRRAAGYWR